MKPLATLTGLAGLLLMTTMASSASAQARYYPDGTNCSLLDDAELVACQNQIYARQLESGVSQQVAEPAEVSSSHIEGNTTGQSDVVIGAEGVVPPTADAPVTMGAPTVIGLPGPEGTIRSGPTE